MWAYGAQRLVDVWKERDGDAVVEKEKSGGGGGWRRRGAVQ